jgi:predicted glycoside hydrolase/deacetylase ChbG (UPF0249 family)
MKYLIVNGDDLGASPGVNRGIVAAHRQGPLTSASLMVNRPASYDAAHLVRDLPKLSVGLHADLADIPGSPADREAGERCRAELHDQMQSFQELMGRLPTHVDSHHNVHRDPRWLPHFLDLADRYGLPLREHSPVRYLSAFYGQWGGETHLEQIGVENLVRLLETRLVAGVTELSCHPGYCDPQLRSSYRTEREVELRTLCDPEVREFLSARQIRLVDFRSAMDLLDSVTGGSD